QYRDNGIRGVREHYSWQAHARRYLEIVLPLAQRSERLHRKPLHRRSEVYPRRAMVSDLDLNLIGGKRSLHKLLKLLREHRKSTLFIIATGRRLDNALKLMKKHGIPEPDVLITSSGSEIYYAPKLTTDEAWIKHIDYQWSPHKIQEVLDAIDGLIKQEKQEQSRFKISYYINPEVLDVETIKSALHNAEITAHVQVAFGQYLDVLPVRASKGMALRYVADNLEIPWQNIFVAGGSGADEGMMQGNTMAAVVANRNHEELSQLVDIDNIYFASKSHADGILEALQHYDFFNVTSEKIKN
ncbi:MAG: HAD-IIB family hydrolase, partial [Pseudohongiellaceae bacterium]